MNLLVSDQCAHTIVGSSSVFGKAFPHFQFFYLLFYNVPCELEFTGFMITKKKLFYSRRIV